MRLATISVVLNLGLAVWCTGSGAWADNARSSKMMPYADAREMFRRLGYKPYVMPGADMCNPDDPRCFPELEYCAKSRTWDCTYTWRRGISIIEVQTHYDNPVVARSECVVNCTKGKNDHGVRPPDQRASAADAQSH